MDTEHLKLFVQIVDAGSVVGAAQHLGVSRSVVRRGLSALEAEVGVPLLHRDATGVRLTGAGAVTLEQGRAILEAARGLVAEARTAGSEASGVLRIVEPVGLPLAMHVQAILAARAAMPNQRLVVRHVEDPVACLSEPFEMMLHEGPAPTKGIWYSRVLARVPLRLVASREYLARRGAPETVDDLSGHDTLGWSRPGRSPGAWPLRDGGTVNVVPWFSSSDPHLLCTIAAQGGGLFLAPRMPFFDDPDAAGLEQVLGDQVADEIVFRVTTPFPSRADSRTRETLRTLHQQLDALPMD